MTQTIPTGRPPPTNVLNISCPGPHLEDGKQYVYTITSGFSDTLTFVAVLNFLFCVPTVFFNGAILVGYMKSRDLRGPATRLLFSICLADFLVGLLCEPIMGAQILSISKSTHECGLSNFMVYVIPVLIVVTMVTHALISLERYTAMHYPAKYAQYFCKRNLSVAMIIIWTVCPATYIAPLLAGDPVMGTKFAVGFILISMLISLLAYINMYRDFKWQDGRPKAEIKGAYIVAHTIRKERSLEELTQFRNDAKIGAFYFKIYLCMLAFYLLNLIKNVINSWDALSGNAHYLFHYFLDTLLFLNALVNPILVLGLSSEVKMGVSAAFRL